MSQTYNIPPNYTLVHVIDWLLLNVQQTVFQLYSGREQGQQYTGIKLLVYRNEAGKDQVDP